MTIPDRARAGLLLLMGALQFFLGMFVAEALYPGYHVGTNAVSDLGATCRENVPCTIHQPSSAIFTAIMIVFGAAMIVSVYYLRRAGTHRSFLGVLLAAAIGIAGAGLVNETSGFHGLFALLAFVAGSTAAVLSARIEPGPVRLVYLVLGAIAWVGVGWQLAGTFVDAGWFGPLGDGGVERIIVYPTLLWLAVFGTALSVERPSLPAEVRAVHPGATRSA